MKKKMYIVIISLTTLFLFLLGCASTRYVKKRTQELEDMIKANQDQIELLSDKTSTLSADLDQTDRKAKDALDKAEKALAYSKGFENYDLIGEKQIFFDFDKYQLSKISKDVLDEIGKMMQQDPGFVLVIAGHTDGVGSDKYNLLLGHNRAESVTRYLADKFDIQLFRMHIISYGENKPQSIEDTKGGRAKNRRVELKIFGQP